MYFTTNAQTSRISSKWLIGKWKYVSGWKFAGKNKLKIRSMDGVIFYFSEDGNYTQDIVVFHNSRDTSEFHSYGKWKLENDSIYFYDSYSICSICLNKLQRESDRHYQLKKIDKNRMYILNNYTNESSNPKKSMPIRLIHDEYKRIDGS